MGDPILGGFGLTVTAAPGAELPSPASTKGGQSAHLNNRVQARQHPQFGNLLRPLFFTQLITMAKALFAVALLALLACALAQNQNSDDARELVGAFNNQRKNLTTHG